MIGYGRNWQWFRVDKRENCDSILHFLMKGLRIGKEIEEGLSIGVQLLGKLF